MAFDKNSELSYHIGGDGPPLLLLHGSLSSKRAWNPVLEPLIQQYTVIAPDLPGFGDSPKQQKANTPNEYVPHLEQLLDVLKIGAVAVAGHSVGGWTALELAKNTGRTTNVLALAPAGLWKKRSPFFTDIRLNIGHYAGKLSGSFGRSLLEKNAIARQLSLRDHSASPNNVPLQWILEATEDASNAADWPTHFMQVRKNRFVGGQNIQAPIKVVFGEKDKVAIAGKSQYIDELPGHTEVEHWPQCGHMIMWDAPHLVLRAIANMYPSKT